MDLSNHALLTIFVGLTAFAVLLQACVLVGIVITLRKTASAVQKVTEDLKSTVVPIAHSSRELLERITPQVITISTGLSELTETVKHETAGVKISVAEIMDRFNRQTQRVDTLLTHGLNAVERAGGVVESTVALPVRQVNGIMAGFRAMVDTYRSIPSRHTRANGNDPSQL